MKYYAAVLLMLVSLPVTAQQSTLYAAAKNGLSLREKPGAESRSLDKIPYGTKLILQEDKEAWIPLESEGMKGFWRKTTYNNKTGYVADCYLLPETVPAVAVKDMRGYITQLATPFGGKLVTKSRPADQEDGGWQLEKQLYKNGAEWHKFSGYEYGSQTYFLPGFTLQEAFLLVKLIPEFNDVFGADEPFPAENKTYMKEGREYALSVEKEDYGNGVSWVKKITVEYEQGAFYHFELYQLDNQVVIFFGAGV